MHSIYNISYYFICQEHSDGSPKEHQYIFLRHGALGVRVVSGDQRYTFMAKTGKGCSEFRPGD